MVIQAPIYRPFRVRWSRARYGPLNLFFQEDAVIAVFLTALLCKPTGDAQGRAEGRKIVRARVSPNQTSSVNSNVLNTYHDGYT